MLPVWTVLLLLPLLGGAERFNCRGRILGAYYADAKSGCKAFHVCVRVAGGGIRDFRFFCPPGTLFHQEAQTCTDWGDDDPLACPADLYDGQFDLYKIGSGFDTKKLSSPGNRDDETEFGLQRAETGDRRSQNSQNNGRDDLRAAHSSDFFSGQRDRGRDDAPAPSTPPRAPPARQSFRRATTPRAPPTTQYTQPPSPQPSSPAQYEPVSKQQRKLVRKRPIYVQSTAEPSSPTYQNTPPQQQYTQQPYSQQPFSQPPQQHYHRLPTKPTTIAPADVPPQYKDEYVEVSRVAPKQTPNRYYPNNPTQVPFAQPSSPAQFNKKEGLSELYNYDAQSTPGFNVQNENRQPFKVRNNFNVADAPREDFARTNYNSNNGRSTPTTTEYTTTTRNFPTSTPAYNNRNFNNVAYEPEKNNFAQYREPKQNYYSSPTTIPTTTFYTTTRPESHANLNTVAYNTNIALNTIQPANYPDNDEDDGQYRPPAGEDDGQYRPELYERDRERDRELLSGAHSLNIAASGNRLPEDQKAHSKVNHVKLQGQTSAPRPFRPAPTPTSPPTTRAPEPTYTTTYRPTTTVNTQRTFDYFQTYTTTSRPYSEQSTTNNNFNNAPVRSQSTSAPRVPEVRPTVAAPRPPELKLTSPPRPAEPKQRAPAPPTVAPARPTTRAPHFSQPANKKEDASYDYAYYDSDPGFSEYDHIEEFGKTKTRT